MKEKEICDYFIEYEYKNNLFDLTIGNVKIWIYLREIVYCDILKIKGCINDSFTQLKNKKKYDSIVSLFIRNKAYKYVFNNPLKKVEESDLLILTHPRRIKNAGFYDCTVFDPILEHINNKYTVLEEPLWVDSLADFESHYSPVRTRNLIYSDRIEFLFEMKYRVNKFLAKVFRIKVLNNKEIKIIKKILNGLDEIFNVNLNKGKYIDLFGKFYLYESFTTHKYEQLIKKINPKLILEYYSPTRTKQVMNRIAANNNIPTLDFQHGMFARNEPLMVNYFKKIKLDNFPDKILLFGEFWKRGVRFPIEDDNLISVGYPLFDEKKSKLKKVNKNKYITFLSQGKIGVELSKLAADLSILLEDSNSEYTILYKTHPFEHNKWKHEYPWLLNKENIKVFDSNEKDIYYFFEQSVCIVGVYSTAIYEGAALNLLTFIYNGYSSNELEYLYSNYNNVNLVSTAEDIINILNLKKNEEISKANFNEIFKENSIENIKDFIDWELNR